MRLILLLLLVLVCTGCGETKEEKAKREIKEAINETMPAGFFENMEKSHANIKKQEAETAAFIEGLKTNPQPLFDMAVKSVKEGIAKIEGDEDLAKSTVTVDKKSLKTFGGEKWKVQGNLQTPKHKTRWEVTLEVMFGRVQVTRASLQVD